ncbi:MAG: secretion protein HlyD [Acidobacteria bacterium]|nr:secretion protein HlyD [Acidobacteriota bacterium]
MNRKRIVPAVLAAAAAGFVLWRFVLAPSPDPALLLASGTVEATDAQLGFQVPGRIVALTTREGDRVEAGAEIARLDDGETAARRDQAAAALAAARAQLAELESGSRSEEVAQARSQSAAAGERVADAERDLERVRTLFEGRAVSREALDKARLALDLATAQRDQAAEQLRLLERGPRPERIDAARAQAEAAQAAVAGLDALLDHHRLRAPFAGLVTVRHREPGEIVPAGAAVVTLLDPGDRWVRIYVPENRLAAVQIGQPASIRSDTYPGRRYEGEVSFIGSEAEFTPKNVQTEEERVRLVYAVKVRVTGDPGFELKPGLPADVELRTGGS